MIYFVYTSLTIFENSFVTKTLNIMNCFAVKNNKY